MLLAVLLVAFGASRSCASTQHAISKERAIEIARARVDFTTDRIQIRYVQRGIPVRGFWAVSFSTVDAKGALNRVSVVLVDAETGVVMK